MKHFISYDISNDAWRDKTAKLLLRHGCKRVQKSVFVAVEFGPRELARLRQAIDHQIVPHLTLADSMLCLPVENDLAAGANWHGENQALQSAMEQPHTKLM